MFQSCGSGRNAVSRGNKDNKPTIIVKPGPKEGKNQNLEIPGIRNAIVSEAYSWLGTKYLYGGHSKKGTDCSGMVMEIFLKVMNLKLPRASWEQQAFCNKIGYELLKPGDLVFFATQTKGKVSHVGIYIGNQQIIHASPTRGVMISNLSENYFQHHYHSSGEIASNRTSNNAQKAEEVTVTPVIVAGSVNIENLDDVLSHKTDSILSTFME